MQTVIVGSTNPVKIQSTKAAFAAIWPDKEFELSGVKAASGVADQPMSDTESIQGALNRIDNIKQTADYKVALEGGIHQIQDHWYSCGWAAVKNSQGDTGIASSVRIQLPQKIVDMIHQGKELAEIDNIIFNTQNSGHGQGNFGFMTQGAITRESAYTDAVTCALARFIHKDLY